MQTGGLVKTAAGFIHYFDENGELLKNLDMDAYKIRQDFAILDQVVNDEPLVYLDNAATTQKPQVVLDTL